MVAAGDHAKASAGAFMDMGEPAGILFLIDQDIVCLRRAQPMMPDLHRTMVVVELHIKERCRVRAPHHGAVGLLDQVVMILAIGPAAHPDREIFRSLDVGAPGHQPVIGRMPAAAELEVFMARSEFVAVEHDLGCAAVARHAAEHLVLAAVAEFPEIGERPVRRRYAEIVFLDPPAHLRHQRLLQGGGMAEQAFGVVVFGFEISADIGVEQTDRAAPPASWRPSARHNHR